MEPPDTGPECDNQTTEDGYQGKQQNSLPTKAWADVNCEQANIAGDCVIPVTQHSEIKGNLKGSNNDIDYLTLKENVCGTHATDGDVNSERSIGKCSIAMPTAQYARSAPYKPLKHASEQGNDLAGFCRNICVFIASVILLIPSLVLIIVVIPFCWVVRRIWLCCICVNQRSTLPCRAERLSTLDAYWLHDSELNRAVLQCLFDLERGLDVCRIRDLVMARLVCSETKHKRKVYPRFTQRVVRMPGGTGYAWVYDDNFNISKHILTIPESIKTRDDLTHYISQLANRPIFMEKPLWEIHILTNFGDIKDTMILFRVHPCIADGMGLMKLFYQLVDDSSGVYIKPTFGRASLLYNCLRAFCIGPYLMLSKLLTRNNTKNMLRGPPLSGRKLVAWSEPFDYARSYRIKQVTRGKLNDIVLSAISGSLRSFMQTRGVPHPYDCRASLLIDLRPNGDQETPFGNHVVFTDIMLPTNTEGAIPRLWDTKHRMDALKNSSDVAVLYAGQFILASLLPFRLYQRVYGYLLNKTCAVITNLPGPDLLLKFGSREIKGMVHWMPAQGHVPLSMCVATYGDQLRLSVLADAAVVPDPELLTSAFTREMYGLTELLAHRRIPGEYSLRTRLSVPTLEGPQITREPTIDELQEKMNDVQEQLKQVKKQLDQQLTPVDPTQAAAGEPGSALLAMADYQLLTGRVQLLKEEFRDLLAELRRQKAAEGATLLSDDEDEEDEEVRQMFRRRSQSGSSRRSLTSVQTRCNAGPPHSSAHSLNSSNTTTPAHSAVSHIHTLPSHTAFPSSASRHSANSVRTQPSSNVTHAQLQRVHSNGDEQQSMRVTAAWLSHGTPSDISQPSRGSLASGGNSSVITMAYNKQPTARNSLAASSVGDLHHRTCRPTTESGQSLMCVSTCSSLYVEHVVVCSHQAPEVPKVVNDFDRCSDVTSVGPPSLVVTCSPGEQKKGAGRFV